MNRSPLGALYMQAACNLVREKYSPTSSPRRLSDEPQAYEWHLTNADFLFYGSDSRAMINPKSELRLEPPAGLVTSCVEPQPTQFFPTILLR